MLKPFVNKDQCPIGVTPAINRKACQDLSTTDMFTTHRVVSIYQMLKRQWLTTSL